MADCIDRAVLLDLSTLLSGEETQKNFEVLLNPDIDDPDIRLNSAVRFSGVVKECGGFVRITATIRCSFSVSCARCLEEVRDQLEIPVELDGFEQDKMPEDDGDYAEIIDSKINLMPIVYENLTVNLPTRLLCKEDCLGLCPDCGTNRNLSGCDCAKKKVDPRLAGLMDFFK